MLGIEFDLSLQIAVFRLTAFCPRFRREKQAVLRRAEEVLWQVESAQQMQKLTGYVRIPVSIDAARPSGSRLHNRIRFFREGFRGEEFS